MTFFKEKQFKELKEAISSGSNQTILALVTQWPLTALAICQKFPQYKKALHHSDFTDFWRSRREALRLKGLPNFRFERQDNLSDADLVTGYTFYLLALKEKEKKQMENYQAYLADAMEHGSFHALKSMMYDWILQPLEDKTEYCNTLAAHLADLEKEVHRFKSPGYLLLATGYMSLAAAANDKDEIGRKDAAYQYLWKYLNWAQLAASDSEPEIHNAYFGKGLAFSNPWGLDSIDKILQGSRDSLENFISLSTQKLIKHQATLEYKNLYEASKESKRDLTL